TARPPRRRFRTCVASVSGLAPQSRTIVTGSLLVLCPARPALRGHPGTPRDHPPRRYSIPRDRTGDRSSTRSRPQAEFTLRDLRRSRQPVEHGSPVPELAVPWCSLPRSPGAAVLRTGAARLSAHLAARWFRPRCVGRARPFGGLQRVKGFSVRASTRSSHVFGTRCTRCESFVQASDSTPTGRPVSQSTYEPSWRGERSMPGSDVATHTTEVDERQSRAVAEQARESQWHLPSFAKELYLGRLRLDLIHPHPEPDGTTTARGEAFLSELREVCQDIDPQHIEREDRIPDEVIARLREVGAFGMKIPTEYGGLGLGQFYYNRPLMLVGTVSPAIGALLSAHQSIGVPQPISMFGTEEQKQTFLPRCARGEISAFLLTEPDVGSDPARLHATAEPSEDGSEYVLDGVKLWTTNGV